MLQSFQPHVYKCVEKLLNQYLLVFLESNSGHNDVSLLLGGLIACNLYKIVSLFYKMKMELTLIEYAIDTHLK